MKTKAKQKPTESIHKGQFYIKDLPRCKTVADLIGILEKLPPKLKLGMESSCDPAGLQPVWFNVGYPSEHLNFEQSDMWDD